MRLVFPPEHIGERLRERGHSQLLRWAFMLADSLNQMIGSTQPRHALGGLFGYVCSAMLWNCLAILSDLSPDPKKKVRRVQVLVFDWAVSNLTHLFSCRTGPIGDRTYLPVSMALSLARRRTFSTRYSCAARMETALTPTSIRTLFGPTSVRRAARHGWLMCANSRSVYVAVSNRVSNCCARR